MTGDLEASSTVTTQACCLAGVVDLHDEKVITGRVRGEHGQGVAGAKVMAQLTVFGKSTTPATLTDDQGMYSFCVHDDEGIGHAMAVKASGYTPWAGRLGDSPKLNRGGTVVGKVRLPPGVVGERLAVRVWMHECSLTGTASDHAYAAVDGRLQFAGHFAIEHVGEGLREVWVVDRASGAQLSRAEVIVSCDNYVVCPDFEIDAQVRLCDRVQVRCITQCGRPVAANRAIVAAGDVGVICELDDGWFEWVGPTAQPVSVSIAGYGTVDGVVLRDSESVVFSGGIPVRFVLDLETWLRLPCDAAVTMSIHGVERSTSGLIAGFLGNTGHSEYTSEPLDALSGVCAMIPSAGRYIVSIQVAAGREMNQVREKWTVAPAALTVHRSAKEHLIRMRAENGGELVLSGN